MVSNGDALTTTNRESVKTPTSKMGPPLSQGSSREWMAAGCATRVCQKKLANEAERGRGRRKTNSKASLDENLEFFGLASD